MDGYAPDLPLLHPPAPECACDIGLRWPLAVKDLLEWGRSPVLLLGLVCAFLGVAAGCLAFCFAEVCRRCGAANALNVSRTPVRPATGGAGDQRVLELLAAAEVRR